MKMMRQIQKNLMDAIKDAVEQGKETAQIQIRDAVKMAFVLEKVIDLKEEIDRGGEDG